LSFYYAATFYQHSQATLYSYCLEGYDSTWSEFEKRTQKEFTNLPEGDYTFFVKAKNIFGTLSRPAAYSFRIYPPWYRTIWAYLLMVVFFLFLVYGGIRLNTRRLQATKARLENKIVERTAEVVRQKNKIEVFAGELSSANQQLIAAKNALWGEMELAKKIQTVLLPKEPCIPGYEIAAYMKPADEVGGDYYDVICIDNDYNSTIPETPTTNHQSLTTASRPSYWLAIGDVSGHGVPAGLIMMMVQTAIRLALKTIQNASPAEILKKVNEIIFENIQKMGEDKYMTLTLMSIQNDGNIFFSGLHQDLIIFRKELSKTELIGTRGMWLGLIDEITHALYIDHLILNPGDTMLLYTDGITEAMDSNQQMYSEEKLALLFQNLGHLSPAEIKHRIIHSLENYSCHDDITLLIIKRLC
jgi:serine phosphatase RsbU (regulator of sigma subunit)